MTSATELSVEERLARLEDERAIERLKHRYTGYCDAGYDAEGIISVFVADGRWVCTPASHGGEAVGHAAMREFFPQLEAAITWAAHYATSPSIEVAPDGQSARARFYFLGLLTSGREPDVTPEAMLLSGTYQDRFVKVDGKWLFAELEATLTQAARWTEGWVRDPWGGPS
jgi:hypothetical protein